MALYDTPLTFPAYPTGVSVQRSMFLTNILGDFLGGSDSFFSDTNRKDLPGEFCYIRVLDTDNTNDERNGTTLDTIRFQFMPKTISDVKQAMYQDIHIVGRSSPFKSYSGSSARGLAFALDFFAAPEGAETDPVLPADIKKIINRLQALVSPMYTEYAMLPPPRCLVQIGDQIGLICVCKSVNVSYTNTIPWTILRQGRSRLVFGATVSLAFEEVRENPIGYFEVREGKGDNTKFAPEPQDVDLSTPSDTEDMSIFETEESAFSDTELLNAERPPQTFGLGLGITLGG